MKPKNKERGMLAAIALAAGIAAFVSWRSARTSPKPPLTPDKAAEKRFRVKPKNKERGMLAAVALAAGIAAFASWRSARTTVGTLRYVVR
ncbi:MAG TPA: hypothetical protein VIV11_30000 [Kofleriaceae bacterium]